jgi:hypothetical protein
MRKGKEQQKNETSRQLKLFTMQAGELTGAPTGGTGTERLNRVELLSVLERQRTLTSNLLERIVDYGNLMRAYKQVASNDGSGGIDCMETEELRQWLGKHINTLRESLLTEKYEVSAVRKVEIQKPDGGKRMLGIPTVKDRLIQQAIHQELRVQTRTKCTPGDRASLKVHTGRQGVGSGYRLGEIFRQDKP